MVKVRLVVDSGAFTAWKKQKPIAVEAYADWALSVKHLVDRFVNLDVIPGRWGVIASSVEVEESAAAGFRNFCYLRKRGITSLPVFHQDENISWLLRYIREGCDWVGISPCNDRTTKQKKHWLDEVFSVLCNTSSGLPCIKTHGFGVTSVSILHRYPWYSADSSSWVSAGMFGTILVPVMQSGAYNYFVRPKVIPVSDVPMSKDIQAGKHFTKLGKCEQDYVRQYIQYVAPKLSVELCSVDFTARAQINYLFYHHLSKQIFLQPHRKSLPGFFRMATPKFEPSSTWEHLRYIAATNTCWQYSLALTKQKCRDRLLSYYYIIQDKKFDLADYVECGLTRKEGHDGTGNVPATTKTGESRTRHKKLCGMSHAFQI